MVFAHLNETLKAVFAKTIDAYTYLDIAEIVWSDSVIRTWPQKSYDIRCSPVEENQPARCCRTLGSEDMLYQTMV
jgi:hypothetical protein